MNKLEIIKTYYESKMGKGLPDYGILGWESEEAQRLRFDMLLSSVGLEGKKLLDVGCGMGNLLEYIRSKNIVVEYTGVDILGSMIESAKNKLPDAVFHHMDIFEDNTFGNEAFDIAYASGIFNLDLGNNREFLLKALNKLLDLSREAVVFNLLHINSPGKESGYSYFHPDEVKSLMEGITGKVSRVKIIEAYLQNDFTVVCCKNDL